MSRVAHSAARLPPPLPPMLATQSVPWWLLLATPLPFLLLLPPSPSPAPPQRAPASSRLRLASSLTTSSGATRARFTARRAPATAAFATIAARVRCCAAMPPLAQTRGRPHRPSCQPAALSFRFRPPLPLGWKLHRRAKLQVWMFFLLAPVASRPSALSRAHRTRVLLRADTSTCTLSRSSRCASLSAALP